MKTSISVKKYDVALNVLAALTNRLMDEMGGETTLRQAALVTAVMSASGNGRSVEMRELAIALDVDRRRVSRDVQCLSQSKVQQMNLLQIEESANDKRSKVVKLTSAGAKMACKFGNLLRQLASESRARL